MNWEQQIQLWNQAAVTILDIRYKSLWEGQDWLDYRLPSNVFLFFASGSAYIRMEGDRFFTKRHHLLHVGKGAQLDVLPAKQECSFYMIYYKAILPEKNFTSSRNNAQSDKIDVQTELGATYHVILSEAALMHNHIRRMLEEWQLSGILSQIRIKSLFFELIHQLFGQLLHSKEQSIPSNHVAYALRYIHDHYNKPINMNELAKLLGYSTSYMHRLFKAETGKSPNDYLMAIRMEQAQQLLQTTHLNLREIAQAVGYTDVYYFSRLYKKQFGLSPLQARKREAAASKSSWQEQVRPLNTSLSSIVQQATLSYNHNENDYQIEGEIPLNFPTHSKSSMTALVMLCLSLLLSACQSGGGNSGSGSAKPTAGATAISTPAAYTAEPEAQKDAEAGTTRMYKHTYGETAIPTEPKRIVTAYHLGHMLALDVRPLGAATYILQYSKDVMDTTGITDLGAPLNMEVIADLEPDLIILVEAYLEPSGGYDAFNLIAPTVVLEVNQDPVKDIRIMGDLLGKEAEAEQWVTDYHDKIAETKERITQAFGSDETFTILNVRSENNIKIYRDRNMGGNILYSYWGLKPQQKVLDDVINGIEDASSYLDITEEAIPSFMGDHIILASDAEATEAVNKLVNSAIWKSFDAVKNNHVYQINFDQFLFNDPISVMNQVDVLANTLLENR